MRRVLLVLSAAVVVLAGVAAAGPTQEVRGQVLVGAPDGGEVARRLWLATDGSINGVTGYSFDVEEATRAGRFELSIVPGTTQREDLSITFYTGSTTPHRCASYESAGDETGTPCGDMAVVWMTTGANASFVYRAYPPGLD